MSVKDINNFQKIDRLNKTNLNNQGCLMKIVEYNKANDIIVEFQDCYKTKVHTRYTHFLSGDIKNPYFPDVLNIGISGNKYNRKGKEYVTWRFMLIRCFDNDYKIGMPTYQNVTCCEEWLLYDNFYEWLHSQSNFNNWINLRLSAIDKDILIKGNKIYSPETCCLVPQNINALFVKCDNNRGDLPIGMTYNKQHNKYQVRCSLNHHNINLGYYDTPEEAFQVYKKYKEKIIKQAAQEEYSKGNITKKCYEAMMNYKVEITD